MIRGELCVFRSSPCLRRLNRKASLTHLRYSASEGGVSVFLVHVDWVSSGEISENYAVVLDDASVLLVDLLDRDDLTLDLSHLVLSLHVVPELGLSEHWVGSENPHSVESGARVLLGGKASANDEELSHLVNGGYEWGAYLCLHGLNANTFNHFLYTRLNI